MYVPILHREYYRTLWVWWRTTRIASFCQAVQMHSQGLAGPRYVSEDLQYDLLCLWGFVYGIHAWVGRSNGLNFVLVGGIACANPTRECYRTLWMKKGDVGMVKRFSKKYGNKGWAINYVQSESYVRPVNAWCYIPTSLPSEPYFIFYYLKLKSGMRPVTSLGKRDLLGICHRLTIQQV